MLEAAPKTVLLRQRFGSAAQLRAHLHTAEGVTLLFFRDPSLELPAAAAVLMELVFDDTEQTRVVRASVLARAEGQGLWLTILNTRFAREVRERGIVARKGRRVGADLR